jgi:predicted extracellular nuclease
MRVVFFLFIICFFEGICQQATTFKLRTIAFYNVENLFDTYNDSLIFDDGRTPDGMYHWSQERYKKKIANLVQVITGIGSDIANSSPDIIGLCEVENAAVLQDLIHHELLQEKDYEFVHFDSPDNRGIDVALLYKKASYHPISFNSHRLLLFDEDGNRDYTRDQLVVSGYMEEEEIHFIINHWPSRRGGEARSRPNRIKAAKLTKHIIDSLTHLNANSKIITMGDFNDDPKNASIKKVLKSKGVIEELDSISLFNPMEKLYKKGMGSLAYRDKWNLFDQFLLTPNLINDKTSFYFWKAGIYNPEFLKNKDGTYKGYPFRTYVGTSYQGGYSDHFPVYLYLIKKAPSNFPRGGE